MSNFSFCHNDFKTLFNNHTTCINLRDFRYFGLEKFKVVCCRFIVCGKELTYISCCLLQMSQNASASIKIYLFVFHFLLTAKERTNADEEISYPAII